MKSSPTPTAPTYLAAPTRAWWQAVVNRWHLEDHHIRLLTLAAEAWDRGQLAREVIAREGLTVPTQDGGPRAHPGVKIKEQAEISFSRLVRELDLDLEAPPAASRPPALRSMK
jgi:P27 family predicted phage terminase small subunit